MTRFPRAVRTSSAVLALQAGCGPEPVRTPANVAGEWAQLDLNGDPLPARREDRFQGRVCVTEVVRSVIDLRADGTLTSSGESRAWCGMEGEPVVLAQRPFSVSGTFTLHGPRGDTIRMTTPEMEASSRVPAIMGVIDGDEMALTLRTGQGPIGTARHRRQ